MLRDLYNKSKEVAEKVTNIIMNYTEVETKVREATSDEAWRAPNSLMRQIADYTYQHSTYREVMDTLYKRLYPVNNSSWRRVYKCLVLLDFLLKNGSEQVVAGSREHIYDLRSLESFQYRDEHGRDHGINVRLKVQDIIKLLQDSEYLKQERDKAKSFRHLHGNSSGSSYYSSWDDSYSNRYSDTDAVQDRYGTWQSSPPATVMASSRDSKNLTPNPKLGSFDDWNVGRERGFVDDVVEQIKEAWDVAKLSTRTILNKTVHQPEPYETNPRMISEEMYTFPDTTAETGVIANCELPPPMKQPTGVNGTRQFSHRTSTTGISQQTSAGAAGFHASEQPRPPSVELINCWDDTKTDKPGGTVDSALPILGTSLWPGETEHSDSSEFGDFVSGGPPNPTQSLFPAPATGGFVQQSSAQLGGANDDLFAVFQTSATPTNVWPPAEPSPVLLPNTVQQPPITPTSSNLSGAASNSNKTTPLASPSQGSRSQTACPEVLSPKPSQPVGSSGLWKDIDSLGIDLDTIACPTKTGVRTTGPSLRQLQQQHQSQPSAATDLFSHPPAAQVPPS